MENTTIFLKIFGETPTLKVLDFLIVNEDFDYSMTDIAEQSEVGYSTLKIFWNKLEKERIVTNTRTVGKAKMYKCNAWSRIINPYMANFLSIIVCSLGFISSDLSSASMLHKIWAMLQVPHILETCCGNPTIGLFLIACV